MNPVDANKGDWRMYYDGTWMCHSEMGVVYIRVIGDTFYACDRGDPDHEKIAVSAKDLVCWWPRAGSYNAGNGAIYVTRKAHRNMRKSATNGDHYQVQWGYYRGDALKSMRNGPDYMTTADAMMCIRKNVAKSVAVSRDIILSMKGDKIEVVFRGNPTGTIDDNGYDPYIMGDPLSKRAYYKLAQEGII
jgi:hypothetical protein